jgi:hypothetical protein
MKQLIILGCLFLSTSCVAQKTDTLSVGKMTGFVVGDADNGMFIDNVAVGPDLILDGDLKVGSEYEIVYRILSRRDRVIIAKLIKAEHSARENAKRRAGLLKLLR